MALCEMRGFLSFLVMWLLSRQQMTGAELARGLGERKGHQPSPGTIYPALKELRAKGLLSMDKRKRYALTPKGKKELNAHLRHFFATFCDVEEMRSCCGK